MLFAVWRMNLKGARENEGDQSGDYCSNPAERGQLQARSNGEKWEGGWIWVLSGVELRGFVDGLVWG